MKTRYPVAAMLACLLAASATAGTGSVERIRLQAPGAAIEVTPALGGRALHFGVPGMPNLIKVGAAVETDPAPAVSADADDIAHFGHDVWLGPQSGWWTDQDANAARRDAGAIWPPDPYLSFAAMRVLERDPSRLLLEGVDSPVTGVRLRKRFALDPGDDATVHVHVEARNIRERPVARDLWFNTRVAASMHAYVPVAGEADVRVDTHAGMASPDWRIERGLLVLSPVPPPDGVDTRRGKLFLQPSAGWIAGFGQGQLLLIRFDHQPRARIHPEQGQVELYVEHGADLAAGLLELEVHAPYRTLAPGGTMEAGERWSVLRYDGADDPDAHAAFLCEVAAPRLRAPELCVRGADAVTP
jgi:hypothetical protein